MLKRISAWIRSIHVHAHRTSRGIVVFAEWRPWRATVLRPDHWRAAEMVRADEQECLDRLAGGA